MALATENSNGMVMPVAPMYGNGGSNGFGWNDGSFWIIILFLFAFMGNGWGGFGNGFGGGGAVQTVNNDVQRGFDQQAVMGGINSINTAVSNGFANAEISRCNAQANVLQTLNDMAMNYQGCCCEQKAAIADLKYTIATEACADRQSVNDALRDIIEAQNAGIQSIKDQMCQDKIDAKNERIQELQAQVNMMNLAASQNAQTSQILADNAAQTQALEQYLNPAPIPAYVVQNPACCNTPYYNGCGCNA